MKKIFRKVLTVLIVGGVFTIQAVKAQQFHSTPTAVTNLTEEAAYTSHLVNEELDKDSDQYTAASEKLRFIHGMLSAISQGATVQQAAAKVLPYDELNRMQVAVKYFDAGFANTTPNRYIRKELMALIAY